MRSGKALRREGGFTYLGLIILVTVIGLVGAATLKVDALLRRAQAEKDLLETGAAFSEALRTYAEATPKGQPSQPPSLQELLKDPRFPGVRRHLRKIFIDPLTGKAEWGIVWANPGDRRGVLAVYSLSKAKPLKVANFDARFSGFENRQHISDWKFVATGQGLVQGQVLAQGKPQAQIQPSLFQPPSGGVPAEPPSLFPGRGAAQSDAAPPVPPMQPADAPPAEKAEGDDRDAKEAKDGEPAPPSAAGDGR
ncbi:type II secretion system protein [Massilia putida]|uniref:type II secretion system protein n=1 Tax=Massilia putida TaxID=1141883 RepID=UPI000952B219|nr:type II secretion system protein [Massilia putida]